MGPGRQTSHRISLGLPAHRQWTEALLALEGYRTAEAVYTSRLHVALPCLAFGTPVWIANPSRGFAPGRFSVIEELGVDYCRLSVADVSGWSRRYIGFLETHLRQRVLQGDPQMPEATPGMETRPSRLWWMRWI